MTRIKHSDYSFLQYCNRTSTNGKEDCLSAISEHSKRSLLPYSLLLLFLLSLLLLLTSTTSFSFFFSFFFFFFFFFFFAVQCFTAERRLFEILLAESRVRIYRAAPRVEAVRRAAHAEARGGSLRG